METNKFNLLSFLTGTLSGFLVSGAMMAEITSNLEKKINLIDKIVVEKKVEVLKPTLPEIQISNVVGGPLPDQYLVGRSETGEEQKFYLKIDGKPIEEYFK